MRQLPKLVLALALSAALFQARAATQLVYYGGPVVSNPHVVVVNWGSGINSTVQNGMAGFYSTILQSSYLDWVSEYSTLGVNGFDGQTGSNQRIGRGVFVGSYTITPSVTGNVTTAQITTEITAQVAAGNLPAPVTDAQGLANTVYMVNFPSGITITDQNGSTSCVDFCGTQDTATINGKSAGVGIIPDITTGGCATGCGNDATAFNNVTAVHAHIFLNLVTDLEVASATSTGRPLGWYDPSNGQICDICNQEHAVVSGYTVEKGWSNRENACIAAASSTLTVCNGSSTYCRQCSAADNGQATGCTGGQAVCEVDATNSAFGECVACAQSSDCSGTAPICAKGGTTNDTCAACTADTQCTGNSAGPHCLATGACGAATTPDGGSGGGNSSSSGCSSAGGIPALVPFLVLGGLLGLAARRRSRRA
jgi:uncharacterized protein (TIGR03382 family)